MQNRILINAIFEYFPILLTFLWKHYEIVYCSKFRGQLQQPMKFSKGVLLSETNIEVKKRMEKFTSHNDYNCEDSWMKFSTNLEQ